MGTIWFLDVGFGDTTVLATAGGTVLVDCHSIEDQANLLPSTRLLTAVFITHQHYDHFDGLGYLKNRGFSIDSLVICPYDRRRNDNSVDYYEWSEFQTLVQHFERQGSKVYKPFRQDSFEKPWWEVCGLKVWMIGPDRDIAQSETRELHDASLVFLVEAGARKCLFTGDASDTSLNWIAGNTTNYCGDILHASHHGSINGADLDFIKKAGAVETVVSTMSGVKENVPHPTALRRYADHTAKRVFRTDEDGTLRADF